MEDPTPPTGDEVRQAVETLTYMNHPEGVRVQNRAKETILAYVDAHEAEPEAPEPTNETDEPSDDGGEEENSEEEDEEEGDLQTSTGPGGSMEDVPGT